MPSRAERQRRRARRVADDDLLRGARRPINEGRMAINGMTIAAPFNGGGVSTYILDSVNVDEVSVSVAGGLGESDIGGPMMNLVPFRRQHTFRGRVHQQRGRLVTGQQPERRAARRRPHRRRPASSTPTTRASRMAARSNAIDSGSLAAIATSTTSPVQGVVANATPSTPRAGTGWRIRASRRGSCRARVMHRAVHGAGVRQASRLVQPGVPAPLRGSPLKFETDRLQHAGPTGSRQERPVARGQSNYFGNTPYHVTQAIWSAPMTNKLLLEAASPDSCSAAGRRAGSAGRDLRSDLGPSSPRRQSGDRPPVCSAGELRLSRQSRPANLLRQPEQLARVGVVRHGVARAEGRLPGPTSASIIVPSFPSRSCPTGSTRACRISSRSGCRSGTRRTAHRRRRCMSRTGGRAAVDAAGRAPLRPRVELQPGGAQRNGADVEVQRGADYLRADAGRRRVQRHHAALRRRLRRVRQRQDALKFNLGHYLDAATNDSEYRATARPPHRSRTANRNWQDTNATRSSTATS